MIVLLSTFMQVSAQSTRVERRLINSGNKYYREGRFAEAINEYKKALVETPSSNVAKFNLGLSCISLAAKKEKGDSVAQKLAAEGLQNLGEIAALGSANASLSAKANYNIGNLKFEQEDYAGAIELYKQALRLNPDFSDARRNLRIAQLRKQNQDQDKDQDKNQDKNQDKDQDKNQDQNKEDQDQKDQNQDQQNQDQQKNDQQQNPEQQPQSDNELSKQAAQQILNAIENNESRTRARKGNEQGQKAAGASGKVKKW
ncbi:MAG: tetratricopeptide repeat protein [Muribaculaceae bacterium]|nr:tetratricopeptide repeat protein [Muribaculaceae bacterium]